jgi:outer membrane protein assembly factor BamB
LTCFGAKGKTLWTFDAGESFVSRPAVFDGSIWAVAAGGRVFKLEAKTGRLLKSVDIKEHAQSQLTVFSFPDGQKQGLLLGTVSGKMMCLDTGSLKVLWQNDDASGAIQTRPLIVAGKVIYGSWDGRLRCLDAAYGRWLWTWSENYNFYYSPAGCIPQSDGKNVFVCAPDGYASSVDLDSGKTKWRKKYDGWESIGLSEDRKKILIKSRTDEFNIIGTEYGGLVQKISPAHGGGDIIPGEPVEWRSSIIFGAQNGFLYRIDRSGRMSPLLFLGTAGIQTVLHLKDDLFTASNVDGRIAVFRIHAED